MENKVKKEGKDENEEEEKKEKEEREEKEEKKEKEEVTADVRTDMKRQKEYCKPLLCSKGVFEVKESQSVSVHDSNRANRWCSKSLLVACSKSPQNHDSCLSFSQNNHYASLSFLRIPSEQPFSFSLSSEFPQPLTKSGLMKTRGSNGIQKANKACSRSKHKEQEVWGENQLAYWGNKAVGLKWKLNTNVSWTLAKRDSVWLIQNMSGS
ncbi:hypothetical protein LSTR_LSTR003102 [Laodelphax striatellus]|uniref:Uncharacterized protein n=1 Tax=Laodelphax striatellus TaxID=195883 RepID=A0A482WX02_LAOST|nr:hypothetical protein LSTR_LSTR003102 [Laodelphax striatellus]